MTILVGADPELFAFKNGKPVNAHGLIKGDKKHPFPVDKGAVQVDGMALEFNINPATNRQEFMDNIDQVLTQLSAMTHGYDLSFEPLVDFTIEDIMNAHPSSLALGCEPDYNAYTGSENPMPNNEVMFRTGGGHVHLGFTNVENPFDPNHMRNCTQIIQSLDATLGVASLMFDQCSRRRELYGKAGAFRPKAYGVEYRTLSNAWLRNKELTAWVYDKSVEMVERTLRGQSFGDSRVRQMIDSGSTGLANTYMQVNKQLFSGFKKEWCNV